MKRRTERQMRKVECQCCGFEYWEEDEAFHVCPSRQAIEAAFAFHKDKGEPDEHHAGRGRSTHVPNPGP